VTDSPITHEPQDYACPFCIVGGGGETELSTQADVIARTDHALALISPRWWPNNLGHALVVPTVHFENIYTIRAEFGHAVHDLVRTIAIAMRRSYGCDGISTRQHNEPAGYQDVWHYHVHVFPRYTGDELYKRDPLPGYAGKEQRRPYVERLRTASSGTSSRTLE
jgi:histidine triad (HIT) family protein